MAKYKVSDQYSYVLSLDAIDLSCLGHNVKDWNSKACLWSKEVQDGESKYYRIEISTNSDEDHGFVASETYKCHICNIDVPTFCIEQHVHSEKHEAHQQLFDTVLNRMGKQLKNIIKINIKDSDNIYFCNYCCKAMDSNRKSQHLQSNYHKECFEKEKCATEFIKTFIQDDHLEVSDKADTEIKNDCTEVNTQKNDDVVKEDLLNENGEVEDKCIEDNKDVATPTSITTYSEVSSPSYITYGHKTANNDIDTQSKVICRPKSKDIETQSKVICRPKSNDDAQSKVICRPKSKDDTQSKVISGPKINDIATPLNLIWKGKISNNNDELITKQNNVKEDVSTYGINFKADVQNFPTQYHSNVLKQLNVSKDECKSVTMTGGFVNHDKNNKENEDNPNIKTNKRDCTNNTIPNKKKLEEFARNNNLQLNFIEMKSEFVVIRNAIGTKLKIPINNYQSYRILGDKTYCQMCKSWLTIENYHSESDEHINNIMKPFSENYAREIDAVSSHCFVCNEIILSLSDHHNLNEDHQSILKELHKKSTTDEETVFGKLAKLEQKLEPCYKELDLHNVQLTNTNYYCSLCEIFTDNFYYHIITVHHLNLLHAAVNSNLHSVSTLDTKAPNDTENVKEVTSRNEDRKPISNEVNSDETKQTGNQERKPISNEDNSDETKPTRNQEDDDPVTENREKDRSHSKNDRVTVTWGHINVVTSQNRRTRIENCIKEFQEASDGNVYCKICNVQFCCGDNHILTHVEGRKHRTYKCHFLEFNRIEENTSSYHCVMCGEIDIPKNDYLVHVDSSKHVNDLAGTVDLNDFKRHVFYTTDEEPSHSEIHYRYLYSNLVHDNKVLTTVTGLIWCKFCNVILTSDEVIPHVLDCEHRSSKLKRNIKKKASKDKKKKN